MHLSVSKCWKRVLLWFTAALRKAPHYFIFIFKEMFYNDFKWCANLYIYIQMKHKLFFIHINNTIPFWWCFQMTFMYVHMLSHPVMSNSLWPHGPQPTRLLCPWNFPGTNTGVGCHFLLQEILPTQGPNLCLLCLLHWQADSLQLSHLGSTSNDVCDTKAAKWTLSSHRYKIGNCLYTFILVYKKHMLAWFAAFSIVLYEWYLDKSPFSYIFF